MSWYTKSGDSNSTQFKNQDLNPKSLFTFYLKAGETKQVLFLDDPKFGVYEVKLKLGNRYDRFTVTNSPDDPFMRAIASKQARASYMEYATILDLTPYTDKDGKERKFSKKAFAVPKSMQDAIQRRRDEAGGSLAGFKMNIFRDSDKSASCGNDFQLVQPRLDLATMVTQGKLTADVVKPYKFEELLAPVPFSIAESVLAQATPYGEQPKTRSRESLSSDPFSSDEPKTSIVGSEQDIPF